MARISITENHRKDLRKILEGIVKAANNHGYTGEPYKVWLNETLDKLTLKPKPEERPVLKRKAYVQVNIPVDADDEDTPTWVRVLLFSSTSHDRMNAREEMAELCKDWEKIKELVLSIKPEATSDTKIMLEALGASTRWVLPELPPEVIEPVTELGVPDPVVLDMSTSVESPSVTVDPDATIIEGTLQIELAVAEAQRIVGLPPTQPTLTNTTDIAWTPVLTSEEID